MALDTVVNGLMIIFKEEVKCINQVVIYMMENGKTINQMVKAFLFKLMEDHIMENG